MEKTIALTRWTFVSKVKSMLFNILCRFVSFSSKEQASLISWFQSPSAVILEPKKIRSVSGSIVSPSICREVMGPDAMIFIFNHKVIIFPFVINELTWDSHFFRGVLVKFTEV